MAGKFNKFSIIKSKGRALNDEEVAQEMRKMTEFIKQEASEKAREIQVKVIKFTKSFNFGRQMKNIILKKLN